MDFVGFINSEWTASGAKKLAMLNDFTQQQGYQEEIGGEPNPMTRKDFANQEITRFIVKNVNATRKGRAESLVIFEELTFG